jgi:hypothetical protein
VDHLFEAPECHVVEKDLDPIRLSSDAGPASRFMQSACDPPREIRKILGQRMFTTRVRRTLCSHYDLSHGQVILFICQ